MAANHSPNFMALHGEKIALGVFVALAAVFIYLGLGQPNYTQVQDPEALENLATSVKQRIDEDHWEAIQEERVVTVEFRERVEQSQQPLATAPYSTPREWEFRGRAVGGQRSDPELLAAGKPHMVPVLGAVAIAYDMTGRERTYPLQDLEDAEPIESETRPRPTRNRNPRAAANPYGAGAGYGQSASSGSSATAPGGAASQYGYPGAMGAPGSAANEPARKLTAKFEPGFDASKLPKDMAPYVVPETARFIAGTALVPNRKLFRAYEMAFENAKGGNANRDVPQFWEFEVQRADVTDRTVADLTDADWTTVFTIEQFTKQMQRWAGSAADVTPTMYADRQLTAPLPPILLSQNSDYAVHPDLPIGEEAMRREGMGAGAGMRGTAGMPPATAVTGQEEEGEEGEADAQQQAPGRGPGGPQRPGGPPSFGPPTMGAGGPLAGGYGSGGYGSSSGYGSPAGSGYSSAGYGSDSYGSGGYGSGGYGSSSYGSGSSYGGYGGRGGAMVTYKQIRFYDFADARNSNAPQPGRKYVYRVRYAVEDPNFPMNPAMQPPLRYLGPDVYARVAEKLQAVEAGKERDPRLWSEWSEPSDPTSLPDLVRVYAGSVTPSETSVARANGTEIEYERKPAIAEVVALKWDMQLASAKILPLETRPGGVLGKKAEATIIDPLTYAVKQLPEQVVDTDAVVLDVIGGAPLALAEDEEEMTQPGYVMLFNSSGELEVRDELEDRKLYRVFSYAEEREAAETRAQAQSGAGAAGSSSYPGSGYGSGYESSGYGGYGAPQPTTPQSGRGRR